MTKSKGVTTSDSERAKTLQLAQKPGRSPDRALADVGLDPLGHALGTTILFNAGSFGKLSMTDTYEALFERARDYRAGDQSLLQNMLLGQALALNSMFTELARRGAANMGEYINAADRYLRLALKAQAQSRATIEALDRLTNGREQTVRHVHVDNRGGQAVIAETVQTGGQEIGKSNGQPHALENVTPSGLAPVWGENPERETVPIASDVERAV